MLKGYMFERLNAKRLQYPKATCLKGYMTKGYNFQRLNSKRLHYSKATHFYKATSWYKYPCYAVLIDQKGTKVLIFLKPSVVQT